MGILAKSAFMVQITYHRTKQKIPVQLIFGRDMIIPINYIENFRYIRQRKHTQIEKCVIRENPTRIDYDFNIGDKVMVKKSGL